MSQRPPVHSVVSTSQSYENGQANAVSPLMQKLPSARRSSSATMPPSAGLQEMVVVEDEFDVDELFSKHTISEVKFVQQQLKYALFDPCVIRITY
jgi:hypothetical protein